MNEELNIPMSVALEGCYAEVSEAVAFIKEVMLPQLNALKAISESAGKKVSKKDEYLIAFYQRLYLWLESVKTLNHSMHFQAIASAARSIFELLIDIQLIIDNKPPDFADRIDAFIQIEKFRIAYHYTIFKKNNPNLKYIGGLARETLVNKPGEAQRIENLKKLYWKNNKGRIEHWSGWNMSERVQEAGKKYELWYLESFSLWSWYVHAAGLTGIKGMKKDGFEAVFGNALNKIIDMFCEITKSVAIELKLKSAMPDFDIWMKRIHTRAGQTIVNYLNKENLIKS